MPHAGADLFSFSSRRAPRQFVGCAEIRFQRDVELIHALGSPRVWFELLLELGRKHDLAGEIAATARKYAGLNPELLRVTGGDLMPALPVHLVAGR